MFSETIFSRISGTAEKWRENYGAVSIDTHCKITLFLQREKEQLEKRKGSFKSTGNPAKVNK